MAVISNTAKQRLLAGKPALGFQASLMRGPAVPQIARAAGYHWLCIDGEHGSTSISDSVQLCIASLPAGIAPIVRARQQALDEAARALDNGAQGVIVPNVNDAREARDMVEALRYAPLGARNWGANGVQFAYEVPNVAQAQVEMDHEILLVAMIESAEGVANASEIAATEGVDVLFIGGVDLSLGLGVPGQFGHPRVQAAFESVAAACRQHGKHLGMGGIYDEEWTVRYMGLGARFVAGGSDQAFVLAQARARARFLESCAQSSKTH